MRRLTQDPPPPETPKSHLKRLGPTPPLGSICVSFAQQA